MKRIMIILLAVLLTALFAACSSDSDMSADSTTATAPRETETNVSLDDDEALTPEKAAAILTQSGKLWYRAGSSPHIGTVNEWYYTFVEKDDCIQAVEHTDEGAKDSFTLRFYYNDKGQLRMRYDEVDGSWRDGLIPADDSLKALGSYTYFYLDGSRLTFVHVDLCKGDL